MTLTQGHWNRLLVIESRHNFQSKEFNVPCTYCQLSFLITRLAAPPHLVHRFLRLPRCHFHATNSHVVHIGLLRILSITQFSTFAQTTLSYSTLYQSYSYVILYQLRISSNRMGRGQSDSLKLSRSSNGPHRPRLVY